MPNIIDIIIHGKYKQISLIIDKKPVLIYEHKGNLLIAENDGFYNCYKYDQCFPNWKAFGGRRFDIPIKDGMVEHAFGQWWDYWNNEITTEPTIQCGAATIEKLHKCYVFCAYHVSKKKIDNWLEINEPSANYYKYKTMSYFKPPSVAERL